MAQLVKPICGCPPPLLMISRTQPLDEAFTRAVMNEPCVVFLVRIDRAPTVEGRC